MIGFSQHCQLEPLQALIVRANWRWPYKEPSAVQGRGAGRSVCPQPVRVLLQAQMAQRIQERAPTREEHAWAATSATMWLRPWTRQ